MILTKEDLNTQLIENGYALIDAEIGEETLLLEKYIRENFQLPKSGFYYSLLNNSFGKNKALSDFIS